MFVTGNDYSNNSNYNTITEYELLTESQVFSVMNILE